MGFCAHIDRARNFLVTEAPHNLESLRVSGKETVCFFETGRPEWGSNTRSPTFQTGIMSEEVNECWLDMHVSIRVIVSE